MKATWKSKEKILMLAVIFWSLLFSPAYAAEYKYIELKPPFGWSDTRPAAINDNGVVVGFIGSVIPHIGSLIPLRHGIITTKAFIYYKGFYTYLLPPLPSVGFKSAKALAVNKWGTAIGTGEVMSLIPINSPLIQKGFISQLGIYTTMLSPLRFRKIEPADINDNGEVVGTAEDDQGYTHKKGFIYKNGMYTILLPPGWTSASAYRINNNGVVLGRGGYPTKGFIYKDGTYIELLPQGWSSVNALWKINDKDEVIGSGFTDQGIERSFLYSDGEYTELLPPGWIKAAADKINNNGVVIGGGVDGKNIDKGFIYKEGKYTELLSPPGTIDVYPHDINDKEEVVCVGSDTVSGWSRGFVYKDGEYTELLLPGYENVRPYKINNSGMVLLSADEINPSSVNKYFLAAPK